MKKTIQTVIILLCVIIGFSACKSGNNPKMENNQPAAQNETEIPAGSVSDNIDFDDVPAIPETNSEPEARGANEEYITVAGFEEFDITSELDPDREFQISKSAKPIRRILKQDVYGKTLSDDFYFYRNILDDNEKRLYDQIYANAIELDPEFDIVAKIDKSRVFDIYRAVRFDNPDLFWLDTKCGFSYDSNGTLVAMKLSFFDLANPSDIALNKTKFYNCADSVLEVAMKFEKDIDKVKYCHDFLTMYCTYNLNEPYNQSAFSAICKAQTVCAGFSYSFQYLCQRLGIPCTVVLGVGHGPGMPAPEKHLWNLVKIDGMYYEMDVTWDNPTPKKAPHRYFYNYFNITSSKINEDHTRDAMSASLPVSSDIKYSYPEYFGDKPGSDFTMIKYGKPKQPMLPVYP